MARDLLTKSIGKAYSAAIAVNTFAKVYKAAVEGAEGNKEALDRLPDPVDIANLLVELTERAYETSDTVFGMT